jgi:hypothetical protein
MIRRGYLRYGIADAWRPPSPTIAEWVGRVFDGEPVHLPGTVSGPADGVDVLFDRLRQGRGAG